MSLVRSTVRPHSLMPGSGGRLQLIRHAQHDRLLLRRHHSEVRADVAQQPVSYKGLASPQFPTFSCAARFMFDRALHVPLLRARPPS
eukprot:3294494-Pleurochrysis_carterae.AAC.7